MNKNYMSIDIEGDFVDSFIYSGTLFLVHANSQLSTYNWESMLLSRLYDDSSVDFTLIDYLRDCRNHYNNINDISYSIDIDKITLDQHKVDNIALSSWPTDIYAYSNSMYISSENGVKEMPFDHISRKFKKGHDFQIWNEYSYKVSPNNYHRIAIASGINGLIGVFPRKGFIKEREDIEILLEEDIYDCEWIDRRLISKSSESVFISIFEELPKKEENEDNNSFYNRLNSIKRKYPKSKKFKAQNNKSPLYAWLAGNKIFSLYDNGDILVEEIQVGVDDKYTPIYKANINLTSDNLENLLSARSCLFGSVIEIGDNLYSITEEGIEPICSRPVSWRVFPRAKNYINHLHIVMNDKLRIMVYLSTDSDKIVSDRLGISVNEVI